MDFYKIKERTLRSGVIEIYPDFKVCRSKDLMIRGKSFYAIWDQNKGLWSTDEYDVQRLVDEDLRNYTDKLKEERGGAITFTKYLSDYSSRSWAEFRNYIKNISDNSHQLDEIITFQDTPIKKEDYVSKRLPYSLSDSEPKAFNELMDVLYDEEERTKLEWAIGAIISGDAKQIQKFIVLYGEAGTGKSTILNIIQKLFDGYYTTFDAKALTSSSNAFSTEVFRSNPLVAIQHDGDLSRIEDNTKLNSIVSHEDMTMNEKFKSSYTAKTNCFLFLGTNRPVKITDAKSGIIRRLIDVHPTGIKLPKSKYDELKNQIDFELGAIANQCLNLYNDLGKDYYNGYKPLDMIYQTDVFFNFVENYYDEFSKEDGITLSRAYDMYKQYCDEALVEYKLAKYKFREELKNYFESFYERIRINDKQVRNYYKGFIKEKFVSIGGENKSDAWLKLDKTISLLDDELKDCPAQYAKSTNSGTEIPSLNWESVKTTLSDIDTSKTHYVRVPENLIIIDFDLKDENGNKSQKMNLLEASKWPPTYAEFSKSGNGIHLHYYYEGDVSKLNPIYSKDIEVKVYKGLSSLRRKVIYCNAIAIATLSSGLPLKEEPKMITNGQIKTEKALRAFIEKNLRKEIHGYTKPSIDFIYKKLEEFYNSGIIYDVSDMRPKILSFAANSTNNSAYCIKMVSKMHFKSEESSQNIEDYSDDRIVFFDVEVFPNLFVICWKFQGDDNPVISMINPTPSQIEDLFKFKLIGFNNRKYDNHIIYGAYLGDNNQQIYDRSVKLVSNNSQNATIREAYNLSYTDIYDFASAVHKQSLKKFEIELGIHHQELGLPWDQPVQEEKWQLVADYCKNDVIATEATFNYLKGDWLARQILAELSGLTVNDTTNSHSAKIIFGDNKNPQNEFVYTDLSTIFPGYKYENGISTYRNEEVGEGGYVYAEPGIYQNVALLDIASMHPSSIEALNLFGDKYTKRFSELKQARIAIKHDDMNLLSQVLDGKLIPFLERSDFSKKDLSNALKTVINSVYGLTSAKFDNVFRDKRNIDNIVAKRGALFMVDLKHAVQEKGYTVAHIKTDSIKIPNATPEIIEFVMEFGKKYGYNFEHEATYERMCLINNAVYIARYKGGDEDGKWTATGAQFKHPYVFKTMFSKEELEFKDYFEIKSVSTAMYLDFNEYLPEGDHNYSFVGKTGCFIPVKKGKNGGVLLRKKNDKYDSVTGTLGYRWREAESMSMEDVDDIDLNYYQKLDDDAYKAISEYGNADDFMDINKSVGIMRCGKDKCIGCTNFIDDAFHMECALGYDLMNMKPF